MVATACAPTAGTPVGVTTGDVDGTERVGATELLSAGCDCAAADTVGIDEPDGGGELLAALLAGPLAVGVKSERADAAVGLDELAQLATVAVRTIIRAARIFRFITATTSRQIRAIAIQYLYPLRVPTASIYGDRPQRPMGN